MGHPLNGLPVPMAPVQGRRTERAPRHGSRSEQRCPTHQGRPRLSGGGIPRAASRAHVDTGPVVHRAQASAGRGRRAGPDSCGVVSACALHGHTSQAACPHSPQRHGRWRATRGTSCSKQTGPGPECHTGTPPGPHCRPQASRCTDTAFNSEDPREGSTLATPRWQTLWEGVGQERGQLRSPGTRQACVLLEPH